MRWSIWRTLEFPSKQIEKPYFALWGTHVKAQRCSTSPDYTLLFIAPLYSTGDCFSGISVGGPLHGHPPAIMTAQAQSNSTVTPIRISATIREAANGTVVCIAAIGVAIIMATLTGAMAQTGTVLSFIFLSPYNTQLVAEVFELVTGGNFLNLTNLAWIAILCVLVGILTLIEGILVMVKEGIRQKSKGPSNDIVKLYNPGTYATAMTKIGASEVRQRKR